MSGLPNRRGGMAKKIIDSHELVSKPGFEVIRNTHLLRISFLARSCPLHQLPRGVPRLSLDLELPYIRPSVSPTSSLFLLSVTTFPINLSHRFAESHHGSSHSR
jgi:hypothetical protein